MYLISRAANVTVDVAEAEERAGVCTGAAVAGVTSGAADVEAADEATAVEEAADEEAACVGGARPALSRCCKN